MTMSPDHPELVYLEALQTDGSPMYTKGRPDGPPLWIVIHDMEASETSQTAENTANYFHTGAGGRRVSSHYCVDNNSVVQCVLLKNSAWTVGNRPGNNRGINWELSGFASQTRVQWLDQFGLDMFAQIVPILRADAQTYNIPLEKKTVAELLAFQSGITSHNDLRLAFGGTTHTDPGVSFPWDVFLSMINEGDDMPLDDTDVKKIWAENVTDDTNDTNAGRALWVSRQNAMAANQRLAGTAPIVAKTNTGTVDVGNTLTGLLGAVLGLQTTVGQILDILTTSPPPETGVVDLSQDALDKIEVIVDEQVDQLRPPAE